MKDSIDTNLMEMLMESMEIRGRILERASITEMLMACVIAKHLTESKEAETELLTLVLATKNFSFDTKRDLLKIILSKPRYDNFKHLDELHSMLKEAVTVRNVLAHQIIDPSQESKDSFFEMDTLTYLRFRKSTDVCKISKRDVAETERILVKSNEYLSDIYENY